MENSTNDTVGELTVSEMYARVNEAHYEIIAIYIPVCITALIANILVIWVVIKDQYMRNVTNYFLVNLSVADLLVAIVCMPKAAYEAYTIWYYPFGETMCKISAYFQCISVASSIFTITAMALDRYLAITRPFGFFYRCFTKKTTIIVILTLWLFSLLLFSPTLLIAETSKIPDVVYKNEKILKDVKMCTENWNKYFITTAFDMRPVLGIVWFIFMFVVPGIIMLFAYSMMSRTLCSVAPPFDADEGLANCQQRNRLIRNRRRVACILLLLAFVFAGCWLPYHIVSLLEDAYNVTYKDLKRNLLLLGHANSALNPIIYCALSRTFRRSIKDLICIRIECTRRNNMHNNMQWADSSGSGTQLHYLQRLKSVPTLHNQPQFTLSRHNSSQKTIKTCDV